MASGSKQATEHPAIPLSILKFGGTSVENADRIRTAVRLSQEAAETRRVVVVVSALGGVTNRLIDCVQEALARSGKHEDILAEIRGRHDRLVEELMSKSKRPALMASLEPVWNDMDDLLEGVYLLRECTPRSWDAILSAGERISAPIIAAAFRSAGTEACPMDASRFIRTDDAFKEASVIAEQTNHLIRKAFSEIPNDVIPVVTGFIGSTDTGVLTTLGRSGSDYTATILAAALDAQEVVIWTDVDGVLSADPNLVDDAFPLKCLNYWEAGELAYFGARVLHPRTMRPLQLKNIPLLIKNTMNPQADGTIISGETAHFEGHVKAVTSIREMAFVTLEGAGIMGVPGVAARALGALASRGINVLMISQASSEQSICFVVRETHRFLAVSVLEKAFELERARGDVSGVTSQSDVAIVAVVGENMRNRPGISGRMFSTLGRNGVNVLAIAQGSSERNISVAIAEKDVRRAVKALHNVFPMARNRAHVVVIGTGRVGSALLKIMETQIPQLLARIKMDIRLVSVANSAQMYWNEDGMPASEAKQLLVRDGEEVSLDRLFERIRGSYLERLVVVDATASDELAQYYPSLLEAGVAIVTPNKRANTMDQGFYNALQEIARQKHVPYLYETTVGAALPVVWAMRDLIRSGDSIIRIEGVVSGTLAFLLNSMKFGKTFSEALAEAHELGYTEPDPRDDLSGVDVMRKMIILAREIGLNVEAEDVKVTSLIPDALANASVDEFLARAEEANDEWIELVNKHMKNGMTLQYLGVIDDGKITVDVKALPPQSPFANLFGTDNLLAFKTRRYHDTPLVIRGAGAGPDVTAGGVFADVVKAAEIMV